MLEKKVSRSKKNTFSIKKAYARLSKQEKRHVIFVFLGIAGIIFVVIFGFLTIPSSTKGLRLSEKEMYVNPTQIDFSQPFKGSYGRVFNDENPLHLEAARLGGIAPEKISLKTIKSLSLYEVQSDSTLLLKKLSHSLPYLTWDAYCLLYDIATDFQKMLEIKKLPPYRLIGTSFTRTIEQKEALRRVNANAQNESAHCYGTTFDISWAKYDPLGKTEISDAILKNILASVLQQYQKAGRCHIKHERKQACFHITAIKQKKTHKKETL